MTTPIPLRYTRVVIYFRGGGGLRGEERREDRGRGENVGRWGGWGREAERRLGTKGEWVEWSVSGEWLVWKNMVEDEKS